MTDIVFDPTKTRPLFGAWTSLMEAAAASQIGRLVVVTDTPGQVIEADASNDYTVTGQLGIIVGVGNKNTDGVVAIGDAVDVLWLGRFTVGESLLDITSNLFVSDTAGVAADSVGTISRRFGKPETDQIVFFNAEDVPWAST